MRKTISLIMLLAVTITGSTFSMAWAESKTLVFGCPKSAVKLEPGTIVDFESVNRMANMFEGLVDFEPGTFKVRPCLATSWEPSEDGKAITFHLRRGVKFHDGTDFNADAVIFSYARQYDPNHPYHKYAEWVAWKRATLSDRVGLPIKCS